METSERGLKVGEVAQLTGISIKALHHYDDIGLLKPSQRDESGYRRYTKSDLLSLQTILIYREMEIPLSEIKNLIQSNEENHIVRLRSHKSYLQSRKKRLDALIETVNKTISKLESNMNVTEKQFFEGFSKDQIEKMNKEVDELYDAKLVAQSKERVSKMSTKDFGIIKEEENRINQTLAELMDQYPAESPEVQEQIALHHAWINNFYDCSLEVYSGLSNMYITDERFISHYESVKTGLAEFLSKSMKIYVSTK